jgi:hypothetical protein
MTDLTDFIITVRVSFTCVDADMARDRVMGIPFGDHDCGFTIDSVDPGVIDPKDDETLQREYRERHGCYPIVLDQVPWD